MTLDQLEMLEAIIKEGSYQAAAKKLHKSQPSLSTGIKKIEALYGIELFSREGYRPVLTDVGRRFYETAKSTLSSYRQLHKLATELGAGYEPELVMSIDPIVLAQRFTPLLKTLNAKKYQSILTLKSGVLFDNAHHLLSGLCDLAIGQFPQIDNELIESFKLCTIELVPVIHQDLLKQHDLSEAFLQQVPNIIVQTRSHDSQVALSSGQKWYVDSHARKTELIIMAMGWGRVSSLQLENLKGLQVISEKLVEPITLDIHMMRHREKPLGPIAREVWEKMK